VPDDAVVLLPNVFIIRDVNLEDSANFLGSPDLIDYAIKKGWHDPTQGGQFCFCRAYGPEGNNQIDERQRRGQYLVTGKKNDEAELPFCVKPAHKLSVKDVITILRFHGEGELCKESTQEAAVFQLRSNMPADIGCIYWRCSAEPCISALTPWYCGITETPKEYYKPADVRENLTLEYHFSKSSEKFEFDDNHAWWVFKKLQDKVRADYPNRIEIVRRTWNEFEAEIFANQSSIEKKALMMYSNDKSAAVKFLTGYSHDVALEAVRTARELTEQLGDN
jgi:dipeptidase